MEYQAGRKHLPKVLRHLGLPGEGLEPVDTPGSKETERKMKDALDYLPPVGARGFQQAAGCVQYFGIDRCGGEVCGEGGDEGHGAATESTCCTA